MGETYTEYLTNDDFCNALKIFVTNTTDKIIYLDLAKSFVSPSTETAHCIYVPSSSTISSSSDKGASVNIGAVAGALGVGGALGTLASGVNVGGSSGIGSSTTTYSQRILSVPPHSQLELPYVKLFLKHSNKDSQTFIFNFSPKLQDFEIIDFDSTNSPIKLKTNINYSFSENIENEKMLETTSFLKSIYGISDTSFKLYQDVLKKRLDNYKSEKFACFHTNHRYTKSELHKRCCIDIVIP